MKAIGFWSRRRAASKSSRLVAHTNRYILSYIYINFCPSYRHMLPLVFKERSR